MIKVAKFTRVVLACLLAAMAAGCGEFGGGSVLVPTVTMLPAEIGGASASSPETEAVAVVEESAGTGPGVFTGRVVLKGTAPTLAALFVKGADIKDKEVCAEVDVPNERLVLSADGGVQNVFVFMKKAPKGSPPPDTTTEIFFDQKNCRFIPHCMIVPVGATLKVLSDDPVAHNTHTNPARNNGVSSLVDGNDRVGKLELKYTSAENPFSVTCDFHSWMKAYHMPLDHPYGAVTDETGRFEIKDVPAGKHEFVVWHESASGNFVERKLIVSVSAGQTTDMEIPYDVSKVTLD